MRMALPGVFERVSSFFLILLAVGTPLLIVPGLIAGNDFGKSAFVIAGVTIVVITFLISALARRTVVVRLHPVLIAPLLMGIATLLSGLTSDAPYVSWLGEGGQEYAALSTVVMVGVLTLLVSQRAHEVTLRRALASSLFIAGALLSIIFGLTMLGVDLGALQNPLGTPSALALFLLTLSIFSYGAWIASDGSPDDLLPEGVWGIVAKVAIVILGIGTLLLLLSLDSVPLWILTLIGGGTLLMFAMASPQAFPHATRFLWPMVAMVVALMFLFLGSFLRNPYPAEVSLSPRASIDIVRAVWSEGDALLGSGPGTYGFSYGEHAPLSVNSSVFWDVRFDRANNHFMTLLVTHGIIGGALFALSLLSMFFLAVIKCTKSRAGTAWRAGYAPFVGWLTLAIAMFFMNMSVTLLTLFAFLSAFLLAFILPPPRDIAFARSPRTALLASFLTVLCGVGFFTLLLVTTTRVSADVAFAKAVSLQRDGAKAEDLIAPLNTAARRNAWSDSYYRNLANALLMATSDKAKEENADPQALEQMVSAAIAASVRATELSPTNVANWDIRGTVYRELAPIVRNADDFSLAAFTQARELAPNNPKYPVALARAYLVRADLLAPIIEGDDKDLAGQATTLRDEALTKADEALQRATELKSDYVPARYYLAFVQERQGKLAEAVRSMELVKATSSRDLGVGIQLALLYLRQGKNDLAKAELNRLLDVAPSFANARWYLSVILEEEGDRAGAIAQVEEVLKTNVGNEAVKARLERLRTGGAAPQDIPEPVETNPAATLDEFPTLPVTP